MGNEFLFGMVTGAFVMLSIYTVGCLICRWAGAMHPDRGE